MPLKITNTLSQPVSVAPLQVLRMAFGGVMFLGIIRFFSKGWVFELYIKPKLFFTYYGFEFIKPLSGLGMYWVFALMALAALSFTLGYFYRISAVLFFLLFTYVELIDVSTYLNHYYFVSLFLFLFTFVPAGNSFCDDHTTPNGYAVVPQWCILIFQLQLSIVYFYAGLAKLNSDWLLEALPLRIWLPAKNDLPFIGFLFNYKATAYIFSWAGAVYDLCIPFLLLYKRTRMLAYITVVVFHILTFWLFPIGMFPFIMIVSTLIFFPANFHEKILNTIKIPFRKFMTPRHSVERNSLKINKPMLYTLVIFFIFQILFPFRYLLYPGNLYWTEQGYRLSWRVMLMEKAGLCNMTLVEPRTGKQWQANNREFLSPLQEKQMATQPDLILQYAHFLKNHYEKLNYKNLEVYAESYATLNGRASRLFIDPSVNLANQKEGWGKKNWILSFEEHQRHGF